MTELLTLYLLADDFSETQALALFGWCRARGADTFTVNVVGTPPAVERYGDLLDMRLRPYAVPTSKIPPVPAGQPGADWTRPCRLWSLTFESAGILLSELKGDLLGYFGGEAWLEDPALYRGPDLMLGVVSHESEGVLRIRPDELPLLDQADIPYRRKRDWY